MKIPTKQFFKNVRYVGDVLVLIQTIVCLFKMYEDYIKPRFTRDKKNDDTAEEVRVDTPTGDPIPEDAPQQESADEAVNE